MRLGDLPLFVDTAAQAKTDGGLGSAHCGPSDLAEDHDLRPRIDVNARPLESISPNFTPKCVYRFKRRLREQRTQLIGKLGRRSARRAFRIGSKTIIRISRRHNGIQPKPYAAQCYRTQMADGQDQRSILLTRLRTGLARFIAEIDGLSLEPGSSRASSWIRGAEPSSSVRMSRFPPSR